MQWESVLYFLLWAGAFAVMMRFGCGSHVFGHHHHREGAGGQSPGSGDSHSTAQSTTDGTAKDPVCGMTVQISAAKSALHEGLPYYFCSSNCRDKFEAQPASYASSTRTPSVTQAHRHGHC